MTTPQLAADSSARRCSAWSKRLRRFAVSLQRLVRRFTIRKPCLVCDKCGWRERHEAEVLCWKCGKRLGGQMIYTQNTFIDRTADTHIHQAIQRSK